MGDPSDFALGKPKLTVPKEFWDSLDNMAVIVERILTEHQPVERYARGTWGPAGARALTRGHGGWPEEPPGGHA